jgi:hypothetical protein
VRYAVSENLVRRLQSAATQVEAFRMLVAYYRAGFIKPPDLRPLPAGLIARADAFRFMREILDAAQNHPSHGGASDGSFTREWWETALGVTSAIETFERIEGAIGAMAAALRTLTFPAGDPTRPKHE